MPQRPRPRARRSRYSYASQLSTSLPAALLVVGVTAMLFGASFVTVRTLSFLRTVTGSSNVVKIVQNAVEPSPGSIAYKLQHNQRVSILVMGVGGAENDAPELSDTMIVVTLDPQSKRIVETSVPRDLWVRIDAWTDGRAYANKINVANEVGADDSNALLPCCKKPQYGGRDGGGRLAEDTVTAVTGVSFDRYIRVDFKAFRDIVDALGGIEVHLDTPLDDCHYPDYHDGYLNHGVPPGYPCPPGAGIHFPAGDQKVNGERALQIARSRDATEPEQATDFARAKRQQLIIQAIRRKALSVNAINSLPQLMDAVQKNVKTDMDVSDIRALYDWGRAIPDGGFVKVALTNTDLLEDFYRRGGSCGEYDAYVLCAEDRTLRYLRFYMARVLVDPRVTAEHAHVQVVNATRSADGVDDRVTNSLRPFGFNLAEPVPGRLAARNQTVVYDYTNGADPETVAWLRDYFGGAVEVVAAPSPAATGAAARPLVPGAITDGIVVALGHDFELRFYGLG